MCVHICGMCVWCMCVCIYVVCVCMVYMCLCGGGGGGGRDGDVAYPSPGEPVKISSAEERISNLQSSTLMTQAFSTAFPIVPYSGDQVLRCVGSKGMRVRQTV